MKKVHILENEFKDAIESAGKRAKGFGFAYFVSFIDNNGANKFSMITMPDIEEFRAELLKGRTGVLADAIANSGEESILGLMLAGNIKVDNVHAIAQTGQAKGKKINAETGKAEPFDDIQIFAGIDTDGVAFLNAYEFKDGDLVLNNKEMGTTLESSIAEAPNLKRVLDRYKQAKEIVDKHKEHIAKHIKCDASNPEKVSVKIEYTC
jgi:hypothetical protein